MSQLRNLRPDIEAQRNSAQVPSLTDQPPPTNDKIECFDYHLKPKEHLHKGQRYVSPTEGCCRDLVVQSVDPCQNNEKRISGGARYSTRAGVWLAQHPPTSLVDAFGWFVRWVLFVLSLLLPSRLGYSDVCYRPYLSKFWGQFWAARSSREHQLLDAQLIDQKKKILTQANYPRQLMVFGDDGNTWSPCEEVEVLASIDYLAVSYRTEDFEGHEPELLAEVRAACLAQGFRAYWLDFQCMAKDEDKRKEQEKKKKDLYRIADVFRGAAKTLIMIRSEKEVELEAWKSWGGRVWTLPEALLSQKFIYKFGSGPVTPISLRQIANKAYTALDQEMAIINGFSGKDTLYRIERLALLKNAIWARASSVDNKSRRFEGYPAEKVYALMGFFEHRIIPDPTEKPEMALARLSMVNDSDLFAERMIALLPKQIHPTACWYSDSDEYGSNLWDVEPAIHVAGISASEALVLEGCRAAAIRWKNFPVVQHTLKGSIRRALVGFLPWVAYILFFAGVLATTSSLHGTAAGLMIIGIVMLLVSPWMVLYATSGRVIHAQPWLIGVKGIITAKDASERIYGGAMRGPHGPMLAYSPTGSMISKPQRGRFRRGDPVLSEQTAFAFSKPGEHMYTLIDTVSNTIYHFSAQRPPTVCVYAGLEGGLGRFILCSENCIDNELHKETVLRMPAYINDFMRPCDWLAIGGTQDPTQVTLTPQTGPTSKPSTTPWRGLSRYAVLLLTVFFLAMSALPTVGATYLHQQTRRSFLLDLVPPTTALFDFAKYDLDRAGDMALTPYFGRFVNPVTEWRDVNHFVTALGSGTTTRRRRSSAMSRYYTCAPTPLQ